MVYQRTINQSVNIGVHCGVSSDHYQSVNIGVHYGVSDDYSLL